MAANESLQDLFLHEARQTQTMLTVFLMNGYQLRGTVAGYDNFVVLLLSDGKQQMIYKHAISTLVPFHPMKLAPQG